MRAQKKMNGKKLKILIGTLIVGYVVIGPMLYTNLVVSREIKSAGTQSDVLLRGLNFDRNYKNDKENENENSNGKEAVDKENKSTRDKNNNKLITVKVDMGSGKFQSINGIYEDDMEYQVFKKVNKLRASLGKSKLKWDKDILDEANVRASEIAILFSHDRPNGQRGLKIGENIYGENIAAGYATAEDVMKGWTESQAHYENMVNDNYDGLAVGCFKYNDGKNDIICWVQLFTISD